MFGDFVIECTSRVPIPDTDGATCGALEVAHKGKKEKVCFVQDTVKINSSELRSGKFVSNYNIGLVNFRLNTYGMKTGRITLHRIILELPLSSSN